jgi:hypothetical protein
MPIVANAIAGGNNHATRKYLFGLNEIPNGSFNGSLQTIFCRIIAIIEGTNMNAIRIINV